MSPVADAVQMLKGMFVEVPGTRLSAREASRLSGLDEYECAAILEGFVDARFLCRSGEARYVRLTGDRPR
ncbi:MAG TPA: hypothetical protein VM032_15170 [Vicinamibacterales bacterium]|nr:hypothetical protein [Vicinamibacterales bacterium]